MPAPDSRRSARFSVKGGNRIAAAVNQVESTSIGGGPGSSTYRPAWTYGVVYAKVTTAIPSGSWASPSTSGRVQLSHWDGSAWSDSGDPVEVVCRYTMAAIPVGRVVIVGWSGGKWILVSGSCS